MERIFFMIQGRWHLMKSRNPLFVKLTLLLQSFFFTIFSPLLDIIGLKSINIIHWFKLYWFNISFVNGLFHENRIHNEYYFETKNQRPIIIDGWSNIGDSMLYFKYLYPESIIYCFEPDSQTFSYLKKNILNNNITNVYAQEKALWWKDKIVEFYFDENPSYTHSVKSTRMQKNKKEVQCVSIVDLIGNKNIDLLKLDVEWSETEILEAIDENSLFKQIDQIILEYHHNIPWESSLLWSFLDILERNWYMYQIHSCCFPMNQKNKYQDIHVFAYKR